MEMVLKKHFCSLSISISLSKASTEGIDGDPLTHEGGQAAVISISYLDPKLTGFPRLHRDRVGYGDHNSQRERHREGFLVC